MQISKSHGFAVELKMYFGKYRVPGIFHSKGEVRSYCIPLSYIFMLIASPEDLLILQYYSVPITLIWLNKIASYECRDFLLLAMRVLGSYRLPLALREKSV